MKKKWHEMTIAERRKQIAENKTSVSAVASNDRVRPLADDMESIRISLGSEPSYSDEDIEEMLENASFKCHDDGVDVTYSNGIVDKFIYVKKLIHPTDIHKVRLGA